MINEDLSSGKTLYKIPVINTVDDEQVDSRFFYVEQNVDDIHEDDDDTLAGCQCEPGQCQKGSCACIDNSNIELYWDGRVKNVNKLYEHFSDTQLYECDVDTCKCAGKCNQRMTPEKFNIRVELYKTPKSGFAVRTRQFIESGTFVAEFVGEVLSLKEAEIRKQPEEYSYHVHNRNTKEGHYVDPTRYGNISRFFNHSCFENLLPMQFFSNHRDKTRASIGFVAMKDILPGSELTIDYGYQWWKSMIEKHENFYCQCSWVYCVFPSPTKFQMSLPAAKKEAERIVCLDHEKLLAYKRKVIQEEIRKSAELKKEAAKKEKKEVDVPLSLLEKESSLL